MTWKRILGNRKPSRRCNSGQFGFYLTLTRTAWPMNPRNQRREFSALTPTGAWASRCRSIIYANQSLRKPYCYYGEEFRVECPRDPESSWRYGRLPTTSRASALRDFPLCRRPPGWCESKQKRVPERKKSNQSCCSSQTKVSGQGEVW